jgi:hypothetical protein
MIGQIGVHREARTKAGGSIESRVPDSYPDKHAIAERFSQFGDGVAETASEFVAAQPI